jgi:superfamily II DNA or RNA helicase
MPRRTSKTGSELFIVDNSDDDWKVLRYLRDWCDLSKGIDIATGYFEIGALLALDGQWQKLDKIRILMGDEVSKRTRAAFAQGLAAVESKLDRSIEAEKETNDFLAGAPAIVEGIRSGKIQCRVYREDKFHAKAYITHARQEVIGSFALVGSSNLTYPGLTENIELNVQVPGTPVAVLQEWYEEHWERAEDVSADILRTIERHVRDYTPLEVYAKSLSEYCRAHMLTAGEWEGTGEPRGSHMYAQLDRYQQEGYQSLMKIAREHGGAFLCDGVGLGKTFIGLMVIERLVIHEGKRVALFVPKTARTDVWEPALKRYLKHVGGVGRGVYSSLAVFSHTDLGRGSLQEELSRVRDLADAVVIDEAHHFRNKGRIGGDGKRPSRYRELFDLIEGPRGIKQVFLLTATPINNRLDDFQHMAELFSRDDDHYFSRRLGVHSLRGHFIGMEKELRGALGGNGQPTETNLAEAESVLSKDALFKALVVQRSRAYVVASQRQSGAAVTSFPVREPPKVADYHLKKTYGQLLGMVEKAFEKQKPLFTLGIYYPLAYYRGPDATVDAWEKNRQLQVCALIRSQFLKRFESSAHAFEQSCDRLLLKLLAWVTKHSASDAAQRRLQRWQQKHAELVGQVRQRQLELWGHEEDEADAEAEEDLITEEMLEKVEELRPELYDVDAILDDTFDDLNEVAAFLEELKKFEPKHDDKLKALIKLLRTDPVLKKHKVLIFSEYADTARYLRAQLTEAGIEGVYEIDSASKTSRREIIHRFAPYYNGLSSELLAQAGESEIRVLISTDVLSEGLNLQDATRLINYDLHWNPVRLMQRIGRVDRRMNPETESKLLADHPEQASLRGKVAYWNFLPPNELDDLLRLYSKVTHKTLRISKTLGIETGKLLRPDDDFEALKEFNHAYEGDTSTDERLQLELNALLAAEPELAARLDALPGRVFSGKRHPTAGARGIFFCYRLPRPEATRDQPEAVWSEEAGETRWYLYDLDGDRIWEEPAEIVGVVRSDRETLRHCALPRATLVEIRGKIEKHIKNTFLKRLQAPVGVKPVLKAWMELN